MPNERITSLVNISCKFALDKRTCEIDNTFRGARYLALRACHIRQHPEDERIEVLIVTSSAIAK